MRRPVSEQQRNAVRNSLEPEEAGRHCTEESEQGVDAAKEQHFADIPSAADEDTELKAVHVEDASKQNDPSDCA